MEGFQITAVIDLSPLANLDQAFKEAEKRIQQVVEEVGRNVLVARWHKEATIALKNPRGYILAIDEGVQYPFENDPYHFVIHNRHIAARFLEYGIDPFDLKKMLQTSAKVRVGKDGKRYIRIPFQHSAESLKKAGIDPREYRNLEGSQRLAGGGYKWGERLTEMGDVGKRRKYFTPIRGALEGRQFFTQRRTIDYTWKTSPFENMARFVDTGGKTMGYTAFRTISEKSDRQSWIHPGIRASHIAETAVNEVKPIFLKALAEAVKESFAAIGLKPS